MIQYWFNKLADKLDAEADEASDGGMGDIDTARLLRRIARILREVGA